MEGLVADFVTWLSGLPPGGVYAVLLAVAYGENVFPPIWGDTVIVLCGSLVGLGVLAFWPTVGLATLGGSLGFMTVYALGARLGGAIQDPGRLRWIPRGALEQAAGWLERWGYAVVAANRFLAGARSVIALLAGSSRLRWRPTALWATVGAFAWCALLVWAGAALGAEWERVLDWLGTYGRAVTVVLVVVIAVVLVRRWRGKKPRRHGPDGDGPPPAVDAGAGGGLA